MPDNAYYPIDPVTVRSRALEFAIKCPSAAPLNDAEIVKRAQAFLTFMISSTVDQAESQRPQSDAPA